MFARHGAATLALATGLAIPAFGQADALVLKGDVLPGIGTITDVALTSITDSGGWLAVAQTDHPNPDADTVLLKDGAVYLREGDLISGGTSFFALAGEGIPRRNAQGDVVWARLATSAQPFSELLFNGQRVLATGDLVGAAGFGPVTRYERFHHVEINDERQLVVQVEVDDVTIPGSYDHAILRIQLDPSGAVLSEELLVKEGDAPFGNPLSATSITPLSESLAINASGSVFTQINPEIAGGYLVDGSVVLQVGDPSPVFPWSYSHLYLNADLGDGGDLAFLANAGTRMLVWNGSLVARQGDVLDAFAPHALQSFGPTWVQSVFVDADGDVFWFADWDDPDTTRDAGVMRNFDLVLQKGVSLAAGSVVAELGGHDHALEVSDNGRYAAFEAQLADGREGVFLADLDAGSAPLPSCVANPATLTFSKPLKVGDSLLGSLSGGQPGLVSAFLALSGQSLVGTGGCGVLVPGGELLIGAPFAVLPALWSLPDLSPVHLQVPPDLTLLGAKVYAQGLFLDPLPSSAEPFRPSNGFELVIGI